MSQTEREKCTGTVKTTGERCGRWPIKGGSVCTSHGGAAPQVQRCARERLDALVDPAIGKLQDLLKLPVEGKGADGRTVLATVKDVLDRAGYQAVKKTELTGADGGPIAVAEEKRLDVNDPEDRATIRRIVTGWTRVLQRYDEENGE